MARGKNSVSDRAVGIGFVLFLGLTVSPFNSPSIAIGVISVVEVSVTNQQFKGMVRQHAQVLNVALERLFVSSSVLA